MKGEPDKMKVCPLCNAIHDGHRWVPEPDETLRKSALKSNPVSAKCPGDLRIERHQVEGVVTLGGSFLDGHKSELMNLVQRVARNGRSRNVAARLLAVDDSNHKVVIETTDDHLAERIGKEVEKAFKGELAIKWQEKDHFVRVSWTRD